MMKIATILCLLVATRGLADGCTAPLFQPPVRYSSTADRAVLVADLDGDGAPEILTSGNQVDELSAFSLLANRGDGTFASEQFIVSGFGEKLEDIADLNGDGIPDLVASNYWENGIAVYRGLGLLRTAYDTATHGGPSRIVDYDRDGLRDIVSFSFGSGNPVRVHLFRGRADGSFEPKVTVETSLAIAASPSMRIHDGVLEILVGEHSGHLAIVRFPPGGITLSKLDAGPGFDLNSTFADVNGDGIADIIDTNDGGSNINNPSEWIFVTLGKPDGGFLERKQLARPRHMEFPTELHAADIDGDERTDLIAGDFRATTLYSFRGDGTGGFAEGVAINAGGPVNDFVIDEVNGDHRPDIVTVNDDRSVSVLLNRGPCSSRRRAVRH